MPLRQLRKEVFRANSMLVENGLVVLTWGNASGIDRERGLVVIKPSGVPYQDLHPGDLVVVDLDGRVVEGDMLPSSDTPTHLTMYKAWPEIGGVVHSHSASATAFAQAGCAIPGYGTTHADFCPGDVPCVPGLTREEVEGEYEANTGRAMVRYFEREGLDPLQYPGTLFAYHGPFSWGRTAIEAANHALAMENVAGMAILTRSVNPTVAPIPEYVVRKHFNRKHGPDVYYGQMGHRSVGKVVPELWAPR